MNDIDGIGDHTRRMVAEAELKELLRDVQPFIVAWAAQYAMNHGLDGWHEDHLRWFNKVSAATGGTVLKPEDVRRQV